MSDKSQKTEKPTQRRLTKAREDGNFPSAKLLVSALQFAAFVAMLSAWGGEWIASLRVLAAEILNRAAARDLQGAEIVGIGLNLLKQMFLPLAVLGFVLVVVTVAVQLVFTQFGMSLKKLAPDLKRLSPLAKIKDLPKQNVPAMLQAVVMLPVFGVVIYALVADNFEAYLTLPLKSINAGAVQLSGSIFALLWKAAGLFLVFGCVDMFRQRMRYQQDMKMTKQEVRDESKEIEGNPMMKLRIRRLRRDAARRNMMKAVPTATAVVVNPTHFAVALKYDAGAPGAPTVVAKGKNFLALRIKQTAIDNGVPIIENPPLAQVLYKSVDVGQEIPAHLYRAVAEILAYVFRLMNGKLPA
ncbi:MAG: EscU/YscU/HrcU family type III secretion system export apparatus switch protein [Bryobacteraceae bacterium]